jgi:hypothetical protein
VSELVTLHLSPVFHNLQQRVERLRDEIVTEGGAILKREYLSSIRARWFRSGATAASLVEEVVTDGNRKTFRIGPTATNNGAPYPLFGEYGTGRRGAVTGGPAPAGYRYGDKAGMIARRFSRIAVTQAKPQVDAMAVVKLRAFGGRA